MNLKNILSFIYKSKVYILIFIISFTFFFILFFPSDVIINYTLGKINSNNHFSFTPNETSLTLFPNLGFKFTRARVAFRDGKVLNVNKGSIGLSILSMFALAPNIKAEIYAFRGDIRINLSGINIFQLNQIDELDLDIKINNIYFAQPLTDFINFDFNALLNGNLNGKLNLSQVMYSNLNYDFTIEKLKLNKNNIYGIDIPELEIANGVVKGAYSRGDISFDNLALGSNNEDLMLNLRGKIKTTYQKPYDFIVNLKLAGALDKEFGALLKLGPIAQYQNTEGVYNFKVKGDMRNPLPTFESM